MTWPTPNTTNSGMAAGSTLNGPQTSRAQLLDLSQKFNLMREHVTVLMQGVLAAANQTEALTALGAPSVARMNTVPVNITALTVGECFTTTAGFTVPTGLVVGGTYVICNDSSVSITITQGAGLTLRLSGASSTGNRVLAARGMSTIWVRSTSVYFISGAGLS